MYLSDVSGAFDRVRAQRLIQKMRAKKIPEVIITVVSTWLRGRVAHVVVGGQKSSAMHLANQVFRAPAGVQCCGISSTKTATLPSGMMALLKSKFADDLNAFREFGSGVTDETIHVTTP